MSKYVIETNDDDLDDRSDELIRRIIDEGTITLSSASVDVGVTVAGKVVDEDPFYGSNTLMSVEPLS